jgi:hypothetical protein
MPTQLTDAEIRALLEEPKQLPDDYRQQIRTRPKRGHEERELDLKGNSGSEFRLILRKSMFNPLDFSIILAYQMPGTTQLFRLRRYNGKSHEHTNSLEGQTFYEFHIHTATKRYQELGAREDSFAESTVRFADFAGALRCMFEDCRFALPAEQQPGLF